MSEFKMELCGKCGAESIPPEESFHDEGRNASLRFLLCERDTAAKE